MPFFDFHLHPTLKCLFSDPPSKFSPWEKLDTRKIPFLLKWCTEFPYILQSQACLSQLAYNQCNLVCIALYAPERAMIYNDLILGEADGSLKPYLNKQKIQRMINSNLQPYRDIIADDLKTITDAQQFGVSDRKVVFLSKPEDYHPEDVKTVYAVCSVEGCHTFTSALRTFNIAEIIRNLDDLRSKLPLISVNLTHLEQSAICNHAFGMLFINDEAFKPTGRMISPDGITILKHCYQNNILIDIKHMSLGARQHLYAARNAPDIAPINQPIVCTHAGFTGISYADIPDYILDYRRSGKGYTRIKNGKPSKYGSDTRPSFNASSINLYDDDIMQILQSGGIIGVSLDKRILGYQEPPN